MAAVISVIATANGKETDGSPVVFSFSRTGDTNTALSVSYQLFGTAKAGSDYTGNTTGTINFAAGSSTATLSLPALADGALIDPYETIIARINPGANYGITAGKQFATATITAEGMVVIPKGISRVYKSSGEVRNIYAFAALKSDGSVISWGNKDYGGVAPSGLTAVSQIFSTGTAFAALKSDGSVIAWGGSGGSAPEGLTGVSQIFSTDGAFAALKSDGSVISWGDSSYGGSAPTGLTGVNQIFSTGYAFAALKNDGKVISWGNKDYGGNAPAGLTGVSQIFSNSFAFAALKNDGSVISWGNKDYGGTAPAGLTGVSQIFSTGTSFAALKSDGSVIAWGSSSYGGSAPAGLTGVSQIFPGGAAFAALKSDGSVISWGDSSSGGNAPAGLTGISQIFSNDYAFAALKSDGSVIAWGSSSYGGSAPTGLTGVSQIFSTGYAFAALKSDGSVISWGNKDYGGTAPAGLTGVIQIFSTGTAFAALKSDGSVIAWGGSGGSAPAGLTGIVGFANPYTDDRLEIAATPTYTLTPSATTINEGVVLTNTITTTNVPAGTKLYYALSGTGITNADFSAGTLTGEGVTDATGKFSFSHTLANDLTTEGTESLSIKLYSDTARTLQVGSTATVSVVDSSTTAVNLIKNGDFEATRVNASSAGSNYNSKTGEGYLIDHTPQNWTLAYGSGVDLLNDVHSKFGTSKTPYGQYVELDGRMNTGIAQAVSTAPGKKYRLSFVWALPSYASNNYKFPDYSSKFDVVIDGIVTFSYDGTYGKRNAWTHQDIYFSTPSNSITIQFLEKGTSDAEGTLLDNISLVEAPVIRGNSLYTIVDGPSWTQAEANSVKLGGHLVTINDQSENLFVYDIALANNAGLIGLYDPTGKDQWVWSSGEQSSYLNWSPEKRPYAGIEKWANILYADAGQKYAGYWNTHQSGPGMYNSPGISETPFIRRGDSAYVIVSGPTWEEAEANAIKLGGHLVTINDAAENEWLTQYYGKGKWIGINDKEKEGTFKWSSSEEIVYTNWASGEPSNSGGIQDYGWIQFENGKWDDFQNDAGVFQGIAEIKLAPNNTPTGTPTVAGTFKVGSTLTIDATAIKDSDNFTGYTPTFKYNWETSTDGTAWSKLTTTDAVDNNNTYILTTAEVSKKIRGVVSYLDGYGTNEVVNSVASESIANVTPTYTLTPSLATINEGAVLTSTVTTSNVVTGTKLYYSLSGTGITSADFSAGALAGEGITDATGKFSFSHTLANDLTTEGAESLSIKLYSDTARTLQIGSTASVSIADTSLTQVKDTTPPTITLTTSKASLTAGDQATITFTLSEDSIDFTASDITASNGGTLSDFKGSGKIYTASFMPKANTQAAVVVSVANKTFSDSAGNFNNDEVEANNKITFFIDTVVAPGVKITLPGDLTTDENGKSVVIPLVLKTEPKAAVRLDFLLSKGAEATLSAKFIEFSTTNWSTPQTLTIKGIEDYVDDVDQKYSLTITGSSTDKSYQTSTDPKGLQIPVVNLINLDDGEDEGADIYGDPGAKPTKDTLNGTEGPDRIYGLLTDDILYGGPGKDLIYGGYGDDAIYGELGDDDLYGEQDNDTLYGGEGNDRLTGGEGFDKLIGGAGNDTYIIDDERDTIDDQGLGTDIDTVLFRANLTTYTMPASIKNAVLDSGSAFKLIGNGLDNNLKGNDNNNEIDGGDGNDVLNGGGGDDLLKGGSGSDTAHYHNRLPGFSVGAEGGAGITANLLTGKATGTEIGNDTLVAIENIETSDGSDTLIGNENANILIANGGNDLLQANGGDDILIGGQGDDLLDGGEGNDQAVYSGVRDDYEVSQDSTGTKVIIKDKRQFQDGIDTITGIETVKFANQSLVLADLTSKTLDFNGDGNVDTFDSILMMRHMMGTYPGESIKKDIPGNFDFTFMKRRLDNAFADTFSLNGGLRLDIDGDKRISAFGDGIMITQHIHKQGKSDTPWMPPGFNPPAGFPDQMQQHLKELIGF
jgi:hypothetical protein